MTFDVTGSFDNPGPLGGYIAICCVLSIGLLYDTIKKKQNKISFVLIIGILIQLIGLYIADSRAALLTLLTGSITLFILVAAPKWGRKHKTTLFLVIAVLIGGILLYQYRPTSANSRLLIWRVSADMIIDAPLTGHGIGAFPKKYMIYQAKYFKERPKSPFLSVADNTIYTFNEFVSIIIQKGIIVFLLVLLLLYVTFKSPSKSWEDKTMKAGLMALLTFSFFSYPFSVLPLVLFYSIFIGSIDNRIVYSFKTTHTHNVILILYSILIIQTSKDYLFLDNMIQSLSTFYDRQSDISLTQYRKLKFNTSFNDYYTTWLIQQPECIDSERLRDIYPSCESYCMIGNYYLKHNDYELAEFYLRQASYMIPTRFRPQYYLWELYIFTEQTEKAFQVAEHILSMPLKIESTYTLRMKRRIREYYDSKASV
nr:O-antigen ligase family protein [Bacteroides sp. 519]